MPPVITGIDVHEFQFEVRNMARTGRGAAQYVAGGKSHITGVALVVHTDAGISGASLLRPGIQSLMQAAMNGEFDILLAEALDRLSRDQEDIAGLFKRMEFAGVKIFTLSEGEISSLHIGLKGTMNAMFLKDLADKTRRGLRGKVENGKSGGGDRYLFVGRRVRRLRWRYPCRWEGRLRRRQG